MSRIILVNDAEANRQSLAGLGSVTDGLIEKLTWIVKDPVYIAVGGLGL